MRKFKILLLLLIVAAALFATAKICKNYLFDRFLPLKYEAFIEKYSYEYGLDKYLVMGVIRAESSFDHEAHSGVARGLMQITDSTAKWIAKSLKIDYHADMVSDPETNIKMGCWYLAYLAEYFADTDTALAAYNAGMGNVSDWLSDEKYSKDGKTLSEIPFEETDSYVRRVNILSALYKKFY